MHWGRHDATFNLDSQFGFANIWGAHAARVLVSAARRNNLSFFGANSVHSVDPTRVRDRADALARSPRRPLPRQPQRRYVAFLSWKNEREQLRTEFSISTD